jgi:heme/copper-type cytochrome/quinol oxidase subunit 3
MYIYYLVVVLTGESLVFLVVFWVLVHGVLSGWYLLYEALPIPEPGELAYGTTLLLVLGGGALGTVYTSRDIPGVLHCNTTLSLYSTGVFMVVQCMEFQVLGVYTNDTYTGSTYLGVSGLHLIHVQAGTGMVGASGGTGYCMDILPGDTPSMDIYPTMEYSYWHLVELVYIYIYLYLYYHYPRYYPYYRIHTRR